MQNLRNLIHCLRTLVESQGGHSHEVISTQANIKERLVCFIFFLVDVCEAPWFSILNLCVPEDLSFQNLVCLLHIENSLRIFRVLFRCSDVHFISQTAFSFPTTRCIRTYWRGHWIFNRWSNIEGLGSITWRARILFYPAFFIRGTLLQPRIGKPVRT